MFSFALLSVRNYPFTNSLLKELKKLNCYPKAIIFDKKNLPEIDIDRICKRIGISKVDIDLFKEENFEFEIVDVENHNSCETIEFIKKFKVDFLVNAGTPRILSKNIIDSTNIGILNCHPGILPYFKGCCSVEWSIFFDKPVGNTIHWMDEGIDSGPILKSKETKCSIYDNYQNIRKRVYQDGFNLLAKYIKKIANSSYKNKSTIEGNIKTGGNYYKPMKEKLLIEVKNKLIKGKYKYQIE